MEGDFGETDLMKGCRKHPGHKNFLPISQFTIKHLPVNYRDPRVFESIQCMSRLACRIIVDKTSPDRPSECPRIGAPYPYSEGDKTFRDKTATRAGTGVVTNVVFRDAIIRKYNREDGVYTETKSKIANVVVNTARHVVFDPMEARAARFDFFYDDEKTSDGKMVSLNGMGASYADDLSLDIAWVHCLTTTDLDLARALWQDVKRSHELQRELTIPKIARSVGPNWSLSMICEWLKNAEEAVKRGESAIGETALGESAISEYVKREESTLTEKSAMEKSSKTLVNEESATGEGSSTEEISAMKIFDEIQSLVKEKSAIGEGSKMVEIPAEDLEEILSLIEGSVTEDCALGEPEIGAIEKAVKESATEKWSPTGLSVIGESSIDKEPVQTTDSTNLEKALNLHRYIAFKNLVHDHNYSTNRTRPSPDHELSDNQESTHLFVNRSCDEVNGSTCASKAKNTKRMLSIEKTEEKTIHTGKIQRTEMFEYNPIPAEHRGRKRQAITSPRQDNVSLIQQQEVRPKPRKSKRISQYQESKKQTRVPSSELEFNQPQMVSNLPVDISTPREQNLGGTQATVTGFCTDISPKQSQLGDSSSAEDISVSDQSQLASDVPTDHLNVRNQSLRLDDGQLINNLVVIVSHPHGSTKHVSIGQWVDREVILEAGNLSFSRYMYDVPTCPGCSGSPIWQRTNAFGRHLHSRTAHTNAIGRNLSSIGMDGTPMPPGSIDPVTPPYCDWSLFMREPSNLWGNSSHGSTVID